MILELSSVLSYKFIHLYFVYNSIYKIKINLIPRIARWWLEIQEFDFNVEYRAGAKMGHVDALSRVVVQGEISEVDVNLVNVEENDWILSAQLHDDRCKNIIETTRIKECRRTSNLHGFLFSKWPTLSET